MPSSLSVENPVVSPLRRRLTLAWSSETSAASVRCGARRVCKIAAICATNFAFAKASLGFGTRRSANTLTLPTRWLGRWCLAFVVGMNLSRFFQSALNEIKVPFRCRRAARRFLHKGVECVDAIAEVGRVDDAIRVTISTVDPHFHHIAKGPMHRRRVDVAAAALSFEDCLSDDASRVDRKGMNVVVDPVEPNNGLDTCLIGIPRYATSGIEFSSLRGSFLRA